MTRDIPRSTGVLIVALFLATFATASIWTYVALHPISAADRLLIERGPLK